MSKQQEMIKQLELLRSMYEFENELGSEIFAQRYIEIRKIMAEQIMKKERAEFKWIDEYNTNEIVNQFELIEGDTYQEEIKEGAIYLHRESGTSPTEYIITCLRLNTGKYFVMYAELSNYHNNHIFSSGFEGWKGYPTLKDNMFNWIGIGTIYILKGYTLADPKTQTLNFSRGGFQ